jgi:hypothetical protein
MDGLFGFLVSLGIIVFLAAVGIKAVLSSKPK